MKKTTIARLERLRKSRSINDVVSIIKEIAKEVRSTNKVVNALGLSLSATRVVPTSEEINIDHDGRIDIPPKKLKVGSQKSNTSTLGVKLAKFEAPPMEVIKKHSAVIGDLHDNALELQAAEALVKQAFNKAKNQKPVLAALKALRKEVEANFQKAMSILSGIADKHVPTEMDQLSDSLVSYLIDHINPRSYENLSKEKEVYVSFDEDNNVVFSSYTVVTELTARTGFTYDEFYIILTGVVNNHGVIHYYLNTMPEFKVPGKFPIGKEVATTEDMNRRIAALMASNEIVSELERKPMHLTTDRARGGGMKNITNVEDVFVVDDSLNVVVQKGMDTPKKLVAIQAEVIPLLNLLTNNARGTKGAISQQKLTRNGKTVLKFIFTPSGKNETFTLNQSRMQEVKDLFDLSDVEVDALKEILKRKS